MYHLNLVALDRQQEQVVRENKQQMEIARHVNGIVHELGSRNRKISLEKDRRNDEVGECADGDGSFRPSSGDGDGLGSTAAAAPVGAGRKRRRVV